MNNATIQGSSEFGMSLNLSTTIFIVYSGANISRRKNNFRIKDSFQTFTAKLNL